MALTRSEQRGLIRHPRILQKFYVYDPNVPDELGGLLVREDKDDKGNVKEGTKHVLAVIQQVQWWVDQGILGEKPVGEISAAHKKLLAQVTRGRSEDNDETPKRVPRYDRVTQSGSPLYAGSPGRPKRKPKKDKDKAKKQPPSKQPPPRPPGTTAT
jgi:hypothetical protein